VPKLLRRSFLLAIALACLLAPAAHAFEIGIEDDSVFVQQQDNRERALQQARDLGASWIHTQVVYSSVRQYGYGPYDDLVAAARRYGMRVEMVLQGDPRYNRGSRYLSYYNPSPGRFATFARATARHFRGRVTRYSIWNEPNLQQFLAPASRSPQIYRRLYLAGYRAIKAVDRRNQVFIGELAAQRRTFSWMRRVGRGLRADGFAYHPYQFFKAPGQRDTRFLGISNIGVIKRGVRELARGGYLRTPRGGVVPIYFTEFSYPLGRPYPTPEYKRRAWIPKTFLMAKQNGVRQVAYYKLVLRPGSNWNSGLVTSQGFPTSSYNSLKAIRRRLVGF
jgi:hypothetical protein